MDELNKFTRIRKRKACRSSH